MFTLTSVQVFVCSLRDIQNMRDAVDESNRNRLSELENRLPVEPQACCDYMRISISSALFIK
jgi:hypothetical protein